MRRAWIIPPFGLATALAACCGPEPARDLAYYADHADERAAKLAACRSDPGRLQGTTNCVNAVAADAQAGSRRFWSMSKPAPRVAGPGAL